MKQKFVIEATSRTEQGTGASRRLRRAGLVPAIVYGGQQEPQMITVNHNELWKQLKLEPFYTAIITLNVSGETQQVVLKDLHRHPVRDLVMHMDLQRVLPDVLLRMRVPLHFKGAEIAPGVKTGGGMMEHLLNEVEVECLPKDLPDFIEVDTSGLNVNESIHLSQLPLSEGVTLVELKHGNDEAVAAVHVPKGADEETAAPAAGDVPAANQKAPEAKKDAAKKK